MLRLGLLLGLLGLLRLGLLPGLLLGLLLLLLLLLQLANAKRCHGCWHTVLLLYCCAGTVLLPCWDCAVLPCCQLLLLSILVFEAMWSGSTWKAGPSHPPPHPNCTAALQNGAVRQTGTQTTAAGCPHKLMASYGAPAQYMKWYSQHGPVKTDCTHPNAAAPLFYKPNVVEMISDSRPLHCRRLLAPTS